MPVRSRLLRRQPVSPSPAFEFRLVQNAAFWNGEVEEHSIVGHIASSVLWTLFASGGVNVCEGSNTRNFLVERRTDYLCCAGSPRHVMRRVDIFSAELRLPFYSPPWLDHGSFTLLPAGPCDRPSFVRRPSAKTTLSGSVWEVTRHFPATMPAMARLRYSGGEIPYAGHRDV